MATEEQEQENVVISEPIDENALFGNTESIIDTTNDKVDNSDVNDKKDASDTNVSIDKNDASNKGLDTNKATIEIDEYWNELKQSFGDKFELPEILVKGVNEKGEKLTSKDKLVMLRDTMLDNTLLGANEEVDSFVRTIIKESTKEGFDRKQFLQQQLQETQILDLPARDLLIAIKKQELGISETNKEGLTDEEIEERVDEMSTAAQKEEAIKIKRGIRQYQEVQKAKIVEQQEKEFLSNYNKVEEENSTLINNYISRTTGLKNIEGIELSEAELKQFHKDLPELMKRNIKETSNGKVAISKAEELLQDILSDDEKTLALMPLLWMFQNNKFKGYSSTLKEQVKERIEKTLDATRTYEKGSSDTGSNEIDTNALFSRT